MIKAVSEPPRVGSAGRKIYIALFSSASRPDDLARGRGLANDELATRLDTRREVVSLWRKRFFEERPAELE